MDDLRDRINLAGVVAVAAVIGYNSLNYVPPSQSYQSTTGFSAPTLHLAAYFVLAFALKIYLHEESFWKPVVLAAGFGLSMEVIQFFLAYRSFAVYDAAANAAGASVVSIDFRSFLSNQIIKVEDLTLEILLDPESSFNILD